MTPLRVLISLLYLGAVIAALFDFTPSRLAVSTMAAIALLSALARLFQEKSITLALMWEVGFVVVVVNEAVQTQVSVVADYPIEAFRYAIQLLLLGHALVVVAADAVHGQGSAGSRPDRVGRKSGVRLPALAPLVVALGALAFLIPTALAALQYGRASTLAEAGPLSALANSASMVAPALFAARFRHTSKHPLILSYLAASPVLLAQIAIGTRYPLLFAMLGPLLVVLGPRLGRARDLARFGYAALALVAASSVMLFYRVAGTRNNQGFSSGQIQLSNEAVVVNGARLVHYFESHSYLFGASVASALTFAVPRSLWPEKPTLLGYWFPRAYGLGGFGEMHSISLGYIGDGYADFGLLGVIFYCLVLGGLLGVGQRFCDRAYRAGGDTARVFSSMLFPAAFFAVRSPVTTLINVIGIAVVVFGISVVSSVTRNSRSMIAGESLERGSAHAAGSHKQRSRARSA